MGCDIHYVPEKRRPDGTYEAVDLKLEPFEDRWYSFFAWLADVRNYSAVPNPIAANRNVPEDASETVKSRLAGWGFDGHSHSWVALGELLDFDYSQTFEDRRMNGSTLPVGEGEQTTFRAYLNWNGYFEMLEKLRADPVIDRIVFWFDC